MSPREIERWRQKGLVPRPERTFGGAGSGSVYPESTPHQVREIAHLVQEGWRLDEVALPLFLRGFDVAEETVKGAFKAHAMRARHLITRRSADSDTVTVAEAATRTLLRSMRGSPELERWRDRVAGLAKSEGESATAIVESALMNFVHLLLTGEAITDEGLWEFQRASGLDDLVSNMGVALGDSIAREELNELLMKLDLDEYVRLVDEFALAELMGARDAALELTRFALPMAKVVAAELEIETPNDFDSIVAGMVESMTTFGLPFLAWVLRKNAAGAAEVLDAIRANASALEAISLLLDHLPQEYWPLLGPRSETAIAALEPDKRAAFYELINTAFGTDRRLAELRASVIAPGA